MNIIRIASRLAAKELTSYSIFVLDQITDKMREEMDVPLDADPYEPGTNSCVFDNTGGNIVIFSDYDAFYNTAVEAEKRNLTTIPKIYKTEKFSSGDEEEGTFSFGESAVYAAEMQKLKMLNAQEGQIWQKYETSIFKEGKNPTPEDPKDAEIVNAMISLRDRSKKENVEQTDLHAQNTAWDDEGNLRYLDLEGVNIGQAPAKAASLNINQRHRK